MRVRDHDFPDKDGRHAIPYGIYDVGANAGFVNVGTDDDTAAFAVESIRRWWDADGQRAATRAPAAAGHLRRRRLQRLHEPGLEGGAGRAGRRRPGWRSPSATSRPAPRKWNKIEHRLFCHITRTWRARPLTSHEVIIDTIGASTTDAGLTVTAVLDEAATPPAPRSATSR